VGKKTKVVFDTNVWIAIFLKKHLTEEYTRTKQNLTIYISPDILSEIAKVLLYEKIATILKKANVTQKEVLRAIQANSTTVKPKVKLQTVEEDPSDNRILECAIATEAEVIVTGDKHRLKLGNLKKTRILTPKEFFDSIK
jgi:putative PIN family toxin of toxin-antitoxin system